MGDGMSFVLFVGLAILGLYFIAMMILLPFVVFKIREELSTITAGIIHLAKEVSTMGETLRTINKNIYIMAQRESRRELFEQTPRSQTPDAVKKTPENETDRKFTF